MFRKELTCAAEVKECLSRRCGNSETMFEFTSRIVGLCFVCLRTVLINVLSFPAIV